MDRAPHVVEVVPTFVIGSIIDRVAFFLANVRTHSATTA
jgi:hypothetical protein